MNNEIIISNIAPQDIIIEGGGSTIGLTAVYVNGINVTVGSVAYVIVPTKLSELENNVGYITSETDPTVPTYIKQITMSDITSWNNKQNLLVSGTNIKTINNNSILGSGNLDISTSYTAGTGIQITDENVINNTITSYNDLTDRPTIPTHTSDLINNSNFVDGNSLSQVAYTGDYYDLIGKPDLSEYITKYVDNLVNYYTKDFMYGLLPKVSDEDTSITLNDTYPSDLKISLSPSELSQDSTNNQLYLTSVAPSGTTYNIKEPTITNGVINVQGKNQSTDTGSYQNGFINIFNTTEWKPNTTYYVSYKIDIVSNPLNVSTFLCFLYGQKSFYISYNSSTGRYEGNATTPAEPPTDSSKNYIEIRLGACELNISEISVKTTQDYTFDGYGPSPSPSYPSEVHTITGDNTIKVCGKNIGENNIKSQTKGTLTITRYNDGTFKVQGTDTGNQYISASENNITLQAGTYTLSGCPSGGSASTYDLYLEGISGTNDFGSGKTFTLTQTTTTRYTFRVRANVSTNIIVKPMIEVGNSPSTYEPHQEQTAQLNLGDLEYSAIGNYKDQFYKATDSDTSLISGKWYLKKNIGKLSLNINDMKSKK
jgi:hypothetical protein